MVVNAPRYLGGAPRQHAARFPPPGEQGLVQPGAPTLAQTAADPAVPSSGFERLDAQALERIIRIALLALVENGRAVEWECLAPLAYELTR